MTRGAPARAEQPFEDGGPVHNPCAGLNAAARAALPAPQLGRQTFRAHDADVRALRALDLEQHDGVCSASIASGTKKPPVMRGAKFYAHGVGKNRK